MRKGIFWIASYPKSGNTWMRIFLENFLSDQEEPVSINELSHVLTSCSRSMFDDTVGIESSDLTMDEIDLLRPLVYEHIAAKTDKRIFMKIHDAYSLNCNGKPLIPEKATAGVVYIIRNPLDVAVSYAGHFGCNYDTAVSRMSDPMNTLVRHDQYITHQFRQKLMSWSEHVMGWMESGLPLHVVRYEDMRQDPLRTFEKVLTFLNLEYSLDKIKKAIDFSSFNALKHQEKSLGFKERPLTSASFFRNGETGSWKTSLNSHQIEKTVKDHRGIMFQLGYLDHCPPDYDGQHTVLANY